MNTESTRNLLDEDGENQAVRAFLALYGSASLSVKQMRSHLKACGFPHWPTWAAESGDHLSKGGAQDWLRHLFALEKLPSAIPTPGQAQPVSAGLTALIADDAFAATFQSMGQYRSALLSAAQRDSQPATIRESRTVQFDGDSQPVADTSADIRNAAQLADLLLTSPVTGERLVFSGTPEPYFLGLSRFRLSAPDGSEWTLTAGLKEGWKNSEQIMQNIRAVAASRDLADDSADTSADARDAARLDWLLTNLPQFHAILFDGATPLMYRGRYLKQPHELRAAIDAAIAASREGNELAASSKAAPYRILLRKARTMLRRM